MAWPREDARATLGGTQDPVSKAKKMATSSAALPQSARSDRRRWRPRARWIVLAVLLTALLLGGWLWLRDSSLAQVEKVNVTGATGETRRSVERAITIAAREMTTLHFDDAALLAALKPYPIVKSIEVRTHPPHKIDVIVHQYTPVATVVLGGRDVPVAADGTVLDGSAASGVPPLPTNRAPVRGAIRERVVLEEIRVLAGATAAQRATVERVQYGPHGVELKFRGDAPMAYFGDGARARDQWVALKRVEADPASAGATYIDLRIPERPAAGGFGEGVGVSTDGTDAAAVDGTDGTDASSVDGSGDTTDQTGIGDGEAIQ